MPVPRISLRSFLAHAKSTLHQSLASRQKLTLVIGNESADLDSMSSSLVYAYLLSSSRPSAALPPYIPIANIPAADISLRPEYLAVLRRAEIGAADLITLDDLPGLSEIEKRLAPVDTRWILVDHNKLQGRLGEIYAGRVVGAIDHHVDEGAVPRDTGEPRVIEKSGSCTSLVTKYCREAWDGLATADSASDVKRCDAEVAQVGLASILIDTVNLGDPNKTREHDREAAAYLEAKIARGPQASAGFDRTKFYEEIDAAKKNIGPLKLQDILRKDYKQWDENGLKLGVSAVVKNIEFLLHKAGDEASAESASDAFLGALERFSQDRKLDLHMVMTTSMSADGQFQREILLSAFTERGVAAAKKFATDAAEELGLEAWHASGSVADAARDNKQWRKVWWQRQVQHSRKRVAPLLRAAMA